MVLCGNGVDNAVVDAAVDALVEVAVFELAVPFEVVALLEAWLDRVATLVVVDLVLCLVDVGVGVTKTVLVTSAVMLTMDTVVGTVRVTVEPLTTSVTVVAGVLVLTRVSITVTVPSQIGRAHV